MGSRKSGGQIRIMRRRRRVISAKKGFTNGMGGRKSGGKIRITRRRVVVFSAKNVFTSGIGGRRKSEGQLDAWHVDQGKRALLGSRHKQLRRVGLSFKYGTKFTEPPASVVRCIRKRSRKHYRHRRNVSRFRVKYTKSTSRKEKDPSGDCPAIILGTTASVK